VPFGVLCTLAKFVNRCGDAVEGYTVGPREFIQIASLIATLAVAYGVVKTQLTRVVQDIIKLTRDQGAIRQRCDQMESEIGIISSRVKMMSIILSPQELDSRSREIAVLQTRLDAIDRTMSRRLDRMEKIHNHEHPRQKS
jgi:hypothetical protein